MTARIDDLTRLPRRGALLEAMAAAIESARATGAPVSLIVIDVDHLRLVNDTFGRLQGDHVLVEVAEILRQNLRADDLAVRVAEDEFVALLPDTPLARAREVAERIGAAVRGHAFRLRRGDGQVPVTVSQGVASFPEHGDDGEALLVAADRALYHMKKRGRDGVAVAAAGVNEAVHVPLSIERFVGRVEEMRTLVRLLEDAAGGQPRVVAISGEAGVGKTALVRQLEPEVRLHAGTLVVGRCEEGNVQSPYAPWAEIISALERTDRLPPRTWRELPQLVASLGPMTDGAAPGARGGSRYLLLEELTEYLRLAAERRPLVLVLDDMQWADSASWDALEHLLPQLERERVLVCLALRGEAAGAASGESGERCRRLARSDAFRSIALAPLTRDELKRWLESAFHRQDVGRELLSFIYRHTGGNPLFVVQALRTLLDEGAVWHTGDRWEWRSVSELRLPVAVTELISRRLARLSPASHALLTAAAVVGREFDLELARDTAGATTGALLDAVDEGVRTAVLQATAERGAPRAAFAHVLLAEVLRGAAPPHRLQALHRRAAQARERHTPYASAEIATHYDRGGDVAGAYRHALRAADQARQVYAYQESTDFLRMAERNAGTPDELAEARARLAELAELTGHYDEAEALCGLAIDWFAGQGAARRALALSRLRVRVRALLGQPARETLAACRALEDEAQWLGDDAERVALLIMISQTHGRLGDRRAAEQVARDAVAIAERVGDAALLAGAVNRLGVAVEGAAPDAAAEHYRRALALYETAGDTLGQANCHNNLGIIYTHRGQWEEGQAALRTAIALGRSAGSPDVWGLYSLNLGVVYLHCGDYERARELFGEALALFAAVKNSERQLYALYNLAHLDRERGEYGSAAELYEVSQSLAQRVGQAEVEAGAIAGAGLARLRQGRLAEAREASVAAEARIPARDEWFQGRELLEALAVALQAADGDADAAVARFERARELAESADIYAAVWLTIECAPALRASGPARLQAALDRYAARVQSLGSGAMRARYEALGARGEETGTRDQDGRS